ncbi:MAG TPA: adenylosuccinate synthetase, partial [Polyangiaceae bacterium]|nr:adenylosuccinate synthetase [Polyangiaceae bacterium]
MSCTIVVGGQYGSEGKGKVVALRCRQANRPFVVRCGGPNSGHTVDYGGRSVILRQVPAGIVRPDSVVLVGAGCAVDEDILLRELTDLQVPRHRIVVDPRAVIISPTDREMETDGVSRIASTGSGTGAALARRMRRLPDERLVGTSSRIADRVRVEPVAPLLHEHLNNGGDVIVEGTQGFGLSLLHGGEFPYVTARDTTAAGFASEVGLSPRHITDIVVVVRTFPIRVGGNSGPLAGETTWDDIRKISGAPEQMAEYTSVTKRLRRVAAFDMDLVLQACRYNMPTTLAVMGLDRLDHANRAVTAARELTEPARKFISMIEDRT